MNYVYHGVPENMVGNELNPLSQLISIQPALYKKYVSKYVDRMHVMRRKLPLLNCLWNDVVQFTPVHPQKVFELQVKLGLIPKLPPYKFFEMPVTLLDINKTVVFFKTAPGDENTEVKWLKDVKFSSLNKIPDATINYYKTLIGTGELPFNYQFIPHVVHKGSVDVSKSRIITLA